LEQLEVPGDVDEAHESSAQRLDRDQPNDQKLGKSVLGDFGTAKIATGLAGSLGKSVLGDFGTAKIATGLAGSLGKSVLGDLDTAKIATALTGSLGKSVLGDFGTAKIATGLAGSLGKSVLGDLDTAKIATALTGSLGKSVLGDFGTAKIATGLAGSLGELRGFGASAALGKSVLGDLDTAKIATGLAGTIAALKDLTHADRSLLISETSSLLLEAEAQSLHRPFDVQPRGMISNSTVAKIFVVALLLELYFVAIMALPGPYKAFVDLVGPLGLLGLMEFFRRKP
jgi:hypothetical protein